MLMACFPHAGGSDSIYRSWAPDLAGDTEICFPSRFAQQSPGSPDAPTVQSVAAECATELSMRPPGPLAFFGHSLGALVAFETARELTSRGLRGPLALYVSGHPAPHLPTHGRQLRDLPTDEFWEEIQLMGGTPPELSESDELRRLAEPRLRAEFRAGETYRYVPGMPLECDVLAFTGADDDRAPPAAAGPWRLHTTGHFGLEVLPGGHFFIEESRDELLRHLRSHLAATAMTR